MVDERTQTIRQEIINELENNALTVRDISQSIGIQEKDVYHHLAFIEKTVKHKINKDLVKRRFDLKHELVIFCTIVLAIIFIPTFSLAQETRPFSFNVKLGGYSPRGDLDDTKDRFGENYKDGPNLEISFQHKIIQYFGMEYSLGLLKTKLDEAEKDSLTFDSDITIPYVLATAQGFYQVKRFEMYGGAGMGYYRVVAHLEVAEPSGQQEDFDDSTSVFGMHILAGVKLNITKTFYLGLEGKNIWTQDAKVTIEIDGIKQSDEFNLNGYALVGIIGFRFD